jgi:hypothetical protein
MPRIVTALFEDRAAAQRALQALMESGVTRDRIALIGADGSRDVSSISGFRDLSARDDGQGRAPRPAPARRGPAGVRGGPAARARAALGPGRRGEHGGGRRRDRPLRAPRPRPSQPRVAGEPDGGTSGGMGGRGGVDVGGPLGAGLTGGNAAGTTNTGALPGMGSLRTGTHDAGTADLRTDDGLPVRSRPVEHLGDRRATGRRRGPAGPACSTSRRARPSTRPRDRASRAAATATAAS